MIKFSPYQKSEKFNRDISEIIVILFDTVFFVSATSTMADVIVTAILNSDALREYLTEIVSAEISALRDHLISSGIDEDVIDKCLSSFKAPSSTQRRMLPPNASDSKREPARIIDAGSASLRQTHNGDEVIIVMNYGAKSHAVFGDFNKTYVKFKDEYLKKTPWIKPNGKLAFGFGWVVMNKDKVGEIESALKDKNIPFRKVDRKEYEKEIRSKQKSEGSTEEEDSDSEPQEVVKPPPPAKKSKADKTPVEADEPKAKPPAKKTKKVDEPKANPPPAKKAKEPKSKPPPAKKTKADEPKPPPAKKAGNSKDSESGGGERLKATKNDWGNNEESATGYIFMMLPIGTGGKKLPVAVGWQDADAKTSVKGLASVVPFNSELEEECAKKKWRYLTNEMIGIIRSSNPQLAKDLETMKSKTVAVNDDDTDVDDEDEGEEDTDVDDEDEEEDTDVDDDDEGEDSDVDDDDEGDVNSDDE